LELELPFLDVSVWIVLLSTIALALPNSLELLSAYDPAFGWKPVQARRVGASWLWRPSLAWAAAVLVIVVVGALHLGGESEFLYWQF
jgi:hypothetical protein